MTNIPPDVLRKILCIIHWGLTDIRDRAYYIKDAQIADLADALEILPGIIDRWDEQQMDMVDFVLKNYQSLHPNDRFQLYDRYSNYPVPEHF
jgi:hypothetical protein